MLFCLNGVLASDLSSGLDNVAKKSGFLGEDSSTTSAQEDLQAKLGKIISGVIGVLGLLFLVLAVYGGVIMMTSGGAKDAIKKGTNYILYSVIGLVIIALSYAISRFLINLIGQRV